tara:strand:- start:1597 stop:2196 length:600 start_codon:yes stop_codon:yes gene_type:complete
MKKDDVKAVAALGKVGEKLLQDHVIYDNPGKTTEEHLRKHLVDKLSAGENLDSDQVRFLMDTKPQENLKTQKLNPADQRVIEEKIKKAKGPSATEMWEIYKKTSTGRERAEFKKIEREYNKKNIIKPFYKQPTLKDKPTRKPDALPPGTTTVKMQKEPEPPFDLNKYIKEKADQSLKREQENFDKQYGKGGIPSLYRPV